MLSTQALGDPSAPSLDPALVAALGAFYLVFFAAAYVLTCLPLGGTFKKAGVDAWKAWVPFYDVYEMLRIVGRPGWWLALYFVPLVNVAVTIVHYHDYSKSFGRGAGTTVGLLLVPPVLLFVLWLGSARYLGPAAAPRPAFPGHAGARPHYS